MKSSVTLIKGDKTSIETDYRDALPVNMYAVKRDILGASGYMITYPGLSPIGVGAGIDRGGNYNERFSDQYRISGTSLISVDKTGKTSVLGSIPGEDQASMPYGFNTQAIIANGNMFLYSPGGGFSQVTDVDLGNPIDGVWIDGYYFLTDGEYIYHTDIDDETSIDPLKFATAEFMPDKSLGLGKTADNKVAVFGRFSVEYFVNAANDNFAFTRVGSRAQKIGIVSTHAKCEASGDWYITGGRKEESVGVYVLGVGSSTKVSTREVDKIINEYTESELSDIRMESRLEDDVVFILLHLKDETLCYNENIANSIGREYAWSILKSNIAGDVKYRGINGVFDPRNGKWIYGDKQGSNIGYLDELVSTQYSSAVETILYTPFVKIDGMSMDMVEIETIPGKTSADDAKVAISLTFDGVSYGTEHWMSYGAPLDYSQRFILRRIGCINDWVGFKFRSASKSRMSFGLMELTYG